MKTITYSKGAERKRMWEFFSYVIMLPLLITWKTKKKKEIICQRRWLQARKVRVWFVQLILCKIHLPPFPGRLQSYDKNGFFPIILAALSYLNQFSLCYGWKCSIQIQMSCSSHIFVFWFLVDSYQKTKISAIKFVYLFFQLLKTSFNQFL